MLVLRGLFVSAILRLSISFSPTTKDDAVATKSYDLVAVQRSSGVLIIT